MTVIEHTSPAGTYGAPKRAAALLAAAARNTQGPSARLLAARAALGGIAGFAAGSALFAAAALAALLLLPVYIAAEILFALHFVRRVARINALPGPGAAHEPDSEGLLADGAAAFERFLAAAARMSADKQGFEGAAGARRVEQLIARWCGGHSDGAGDGADQTRLATRGNAAEMLTYGFYYRSQAQMAQAGFPDAGADMVARLEKAIKREFAPGPANPSISLMAHLREPVRAHWRPLAFYAATEVVALAKHWAMLCSGWTYARGPHGATVYTFGAFGAAAAGNNNGNNKQTPVLFSHGVGLGLAPYVPMVTRLAATGRPVVAVEYKHLAMRWTRRVPTVEEAAAELAATLASLGAARCDAIGHSFGTLFLSRLSQLRPDLVRTLALMDPVCCSMWTGDLVGTFVYNPYHAARNGWITWTIARDLHTAAAVSRRFFWSHYNFWGCAQTSASPRTLLAVGGKDALVSASHVEGTVVAAAASSGGRVTMLRHVEREHADVVFHPSWQRRVLDEALAQIAAADCDDLVEELRSEAAVVATVSVSAPVSAAAAAAPRLVRSSTIKASWAIAPARGFSLPPVSAAAACADGDDEHDGALLPMQRSYTISAGVEVEPRPPSSSPASAWPRRRSGGGGGFRHHARSSSSSSSSSFSSGCASSCNFSSCDLGSLASFGVPEEPEMEEEQTQEQQQLLLLQLASPVSSSGADDDDASARAAFAGHRRAQQLKAAASPFGPSDAAFRGSGMMMSACECA